MARSDNAPVRRARVLLDNPSGRALNNALAEQEGSVVRALACLLLDEINGLRSHAGLPPRDQEQFLS
jgi:hypothetical protein